MIPVTLAERPHPFPSRTRQLSSPAPKILRGQPFGKIGRRRDFCVSGGHQIPTSSVGSATRSWSILGRMTVERTDHAPAPEPRHAGSDAPRRGARGQRRARYLPVPARRRRRLAERGRDRPASLHRGLPAGAADHREAASPVPHAGARLVRHVRGRARGSRTGRRGPARRRPPHAPHDAGRHGADPLRPAGPRRFARIGPPARPPSSILLAVAFVGIVISRPAGSGASPGGAAGPTGSPAVTAPAPSPAPPAAVAEPSDVAGRGRARRRSSPSSRPRTPRRRRPRRPPTRSSPATPSAGSRPSTARPGRCSPS